MQYWGRRPEKQGVTPARPIVTRAETAECMCPDFCDRDHEQD